MLKKTFVPARDSRIQLNYFLGVGEDDSVHSSVCVCKGRGGGTKCMAHATAKFLFNFLNYGNHKR